MKFFEVHRHERCYGVSEVQACGATILETIR